MESDTESEKYSDVDPTKYEITDNSSEDIVNESFDEDHQNSESSSDDSFKPNQKFGRRIINDSETSSEYNESDEDEATQDEVVPISFKAPVTSSSESINHMVSNSESNVKHSESDEGDATEEELVTTSLNASVKSSSKTEMEILNNSVLTTSNRQTKNLNLTSAMDNRRMTHQFQFNANGILNSTSVTSNEQPIDETSSTDSIKIINNSDSDIIDVSSDETEANINIKSPFKFEKLKPVQQPTLHEFITSKKNSDNNPSEQAGKDVQEKNEHELVTFNQYKAQELRVANAKRDFQNFKKIATTVDLQTLPDKGKLMLDKVSFAEKRLQCEKEKLDNMVISAESDEIVHNHEPIKQFDWADIQAGANAVLPKTFGKKAMETYNTQKAVTMDRLQQLYGALETCPKENDMEEDPKGLRVALMTHQRRALAWLLFREREKPSGGILADDMGLGKTLTMISLIVKSKIDEQSNSEEETEKPNKFIGKNKKYDGGSLIICPASLINQWSGEIENRLKRGLVSYYLYHGPKRETNVRRLIEYDIVITTYSIVNNESEKDGALNRVKWKRIILDEAHQIRNHKSQTSEACCQLSAKSRWALTGTPMHNKELDMYALLKFLRCTPFDDLQVWKRWVGDKSSGGQERLHTVISSLMLRRTKAELMEKGVLNFMPEKKWILVKIELDKSELQVYHKILIFSQTLFAQFLHQRAEKNQDYVDLHRPNNHGPNQEYFKMREKLLKINKVKNVSQHEILVLLLRLRQICCHPSLITAMIEESLDDGEEENSREELNILEQLQKLNIEDDEDKFKPFSNIEAIDIKDKVNLKEATKGHLKLSDPVFSTERASSKIRYMINLLKEQILPSNDKVIMVSQWSSYLSLIAIHLKQLNLEFDQLDGKVPVNKRMEMVNKFNDPKSPMKVLLLSLTAGGVGLNLVGANHLFLLDLHWNPQLEKQAQDRIYRVGQTKPVFVYKFMAIDTIEERIKMLQDKKLEMAEGLLTGTKQVFQNKLSFDDLKTIFAM
ncbi:hypothetical protein ABEB36_008363 [Hypothenemus hampei]|uniref:Transcription termination factor 2 n=1 Tax=Hypothenemus hampei TaxID=57062 RepID=A0ABD1ENT2_HYPHA